MEVKDLLVEHIGCSHYKKLSMQPIELIVKAKLSFIQGNIIKYITMYKYKNGVEDINKCIHYANLAIDLNDTGPKHKMLNIAYSYCSVNKLSAPQTNVIMACVQDDYYSVIRHCKHLVKLESKV